MKNEEIIEKVFGSIGSDNVYTTTLEQLTEAMNKARESEKIKIRTMEEMFRNEY